MGGGGVSPLLWKLITGVSQYVKGNQLWFQPVLIYSTILMFFVLRKSRTRYDYSRYRYYLIMLLLLSLSLFLQYSQLNMKLFGTQIYELKYTCGRFFEMLPYACVGIVLGSLKLLNDTHGHKRVVRSAYLLLLSATVTVLIKYCDVNGIDGFGYQGVERLVISTIIFIIFCGLEMKWISKLCAQIIRYISSLTVGIYGAHMLIQYCLDEMITENSVLENYSWGSTIVVFATSLLISGVLYKIPINYVRGAVS